LQDKYLQEAESLFQFVQKSFSTDENHFYHTYKNGEAKIPAFLDDYAYLIESAIHLQEISSNKEYLFFAKKLTNFVMENFSEEDGHFFFFTAKNQTDIIMRKVDLYDGATPSANGIIMKNIAYLGKVFAIKDWSQKSMQMLVSLKTVILKHPNSFGVWAAELLNSYANTYEIIIVGTDKTKHLQKVLHAYIPNKILQSTNEDFNMPLITKKYVFNKTLLYLCLNSTCKHPYEQAESLVRDIKMQVF
jgi:uncharacterized protein YyaL (SSP411 family)